MEPIDWRTMLWALALYPPIWFGVAAGVVGAFFGMWWLGPAVYFLTSLVYR